MRGFLLNCLFFVQIVFVASLTPQQAAIARQVMRARKAPAWSVLIDAVQADNIAYADADLKRIYIDAARLRNTPTTFANIVAHECGHLNGGRHFDGSFGMQYSATQNVAGEIVEDAYLLIPNININPLPLQPPAPILPLQGVPVETRCVSHSCNLL